jgi:hypothetical protein
MDMRIEEKELLHDTHGLCSQGKAHAREWSTFRYYKVILYDTTARGCFHAYLSSLKRFT